MNTENITLSGNDKLTLISNFNTMFSAGIPILETVDALLEDAKGNQKKLLETLRSDLMQGKRVYESFSRFPRIFDKVTVNIIKASEEAGTLDQTLKDLKENIKKDMEFNDKIRSAMIYPMVIFVVFGMVMLLMLIYVIPRIASVFLRLNVALPLPTRILIAVSNILVNYTIPAVGGIVLFVFLVFFLYKRQRQLILNIFFSLPIIRGLARDIDLTKFTRSLYLLLFAGIPITSALELTQDIVKKKEVRRAIFHAREVVTSGRKLSVAFRDAKGVIPNLLVKITEAGEKSGSLDKSMLEISEFLDYEVSNKLRTVTAIIEPVMLLFVGGLVGGMMLSIIAPIYGLIGSVGAR
ncbi:MAG: type II secretion system F family protein [Candidatus Levybacteria bacterium]|nr:type II secretion system F family protein [Candidatus Levybacteria bacterium]